MTRWLRSLESTRRPWALRVTTAGAAIGLAAALAGCGSDPATPPPPSTGALTLQFEHRVGGDALRFGARDYQNAAGNNYSLFELRYYVSNLELVRGDGSTYAAGGVHLRDAAEPASRDWQFAGIPDGHYTTLRFTFGLDAAHNVPNGLPPTFENLRMVWPEPLGGGYHFMMLDGFFADSTGATSSWMAHLGRLVSVDQPVPVETAFTLEFPTVLHVAANTLTVPVIMDVNAWFALPHVYNFDIYGGFNMDNPEALASLRDNGAGVFELGTVAVAPAQH